VRLDHRFVALFSRQRETHPKRRDPQFDSLLMCNQLLLCFLQRHQTVSVPGSLFAFAVDAPSGVAVELSRGHKQ